MRSSLRASLHIAVGYGVRRPSVGRIRPASFLNASQSTVPVNAMLAAGPFQLQQRDRSYAGYSLRVVREARVAPGLLVVDTVTLVADPSIWMPSMTSFLRAMISLSARWNNGSPRHQKTLLRQRVGLAGPGVGAARVDSRPTEVSRVSREKISTGPLAADIFWTSVQLGALGRNRGVNGESSRTPRSLLLAHFLSPHSWLSCSG